MDPHELERLIDRELRQLPAARAPRTLMPRVMEAARTGRSRSAAPAWPGLLVAAATLMVIAAVPSLFGMSLALERVAAIVDVTSGIAALMRIAWRALLEPVVTYAVVVVLLSAFLCAAFWKAFRFVAMEGASHS